MSKSSVLEFADYMLSHSEFLRSRCREVDVYRDPDCPLPLLLLAFFGSEISNKFDELDPDEWVVLSGMIEEGVTSEDKDIDTSVATGLIEAMIHHAECKDGLWERIEAGLGPEARDYADGYRSWGAKT